MKRTNQLLIILFLVFAVVTSCNRDEYEFETIPKESRSGKLNLVEGSTQNYQDLEILSFTGSSDFDEEGNFSLEANKADKYQQLLILSKNTGNVVYIGLYDPDSKKMIANDTSTVLSFLLFNPHLFNTSHDQREQYLETARQHEKYKQLLKIYSESIKRDPETVFDFESNPLFYQTAAQIMKESIEILQNEGSKSQNSIMFGGEPTIEDDQGENIKFVNPRHVNYGAGIYPDEGSLSKVVTVQAQSSIIGFKLDWIPFGVNEPAITKYPLGDGSFRIYLSKGLDFSKFLEWNDPVGRATILNTAEFILSTVDLLIGFCPTPELTKLPNHFHIKYSRIFELEEDLRTNNVIGLADHLLETLIDNKEELALWLFESVDDLDGEAISKSIGKYAGIYKNFNIVVKLLSFVNGPGPFYYDLIFAPKELNYYITQKNGILISSTHNLQPEAKFKITPPAGIIGTKFQFDASESTDDIDNISKLEFRWDFESDGTWDTDWSNNVTASHSYTESSSYIVTLSVKDSDGLIGSANHTLNVGGGAGTASHVKLFMDKNPWSSDAMIRMLKANGFTEGTGKNTYEIIKSTEMSGVSLLPGEDLVIISNDQDQTFYNNYAASQIRFTNFVNGGGALFWEACDKGWNNGSMVTAGLVLPGNVKSNFKLDNFNYVTDNNLPLVESLPTKMDHNYASHEFFTDLPDGTTIYCVDSNNNPTLIEFNFGDGWIIITGQPLEHQFDRVYGAVDMGKLLPGIVSYFTGNNSPKNMEIPAGSIRDNKPSTPVN